MPDIEPTTDRDEWLEGDDADEVVTFADALLAAARRESARFRRLAAEHGGLPRDGGEKPAMQEPEP